jgi:hypothetical protein
MENKTEDTKRGWFAGLGHRGATAAVALGLLGGGVAGGYLVSHAASSSSSTAAAATTPSTTPGTFTPNEDPTHETGESAAREAQEDAGQHPTVP